MIPISIIALIAVVHLGLRLFGLDSGTVYIVGYGGTFIQAVLVAVIVAPVRQALKKKNGGTAFLSVVLGVSMAALCVGAVRIVKDPDERSLLIFPAYISVILLGHTLLLLIKLNRVSDSGNAVVDVDRH